jgi:hypothetical protein
LLGDGSGVRELSVREEVRSTEYEVRGRRLGLLGLAGLRGASRARTRSTAAVQSSRDLHQE